MATQKKTLLELMVETGIQWPEGAEYAAQNKDTMHVRFYETSKPFRNSGVNYWDSLSGSLIRELMVRLPELCRNWHQTIVTREQYEAAVAEVKADDGWIEWCGGDRPVGAQCVVDVRLKSGHELLNSVAAGLRWSKGLPGDIIAYRIVSEQPEQSETTEPQYCEPIPTKTIEQRIEDLQLMERNIAEFRAKLTDDLHALGITWLDGAVVEDE